MVKMVELVRQVLMEDYRNAESLYYMGLFLEQGIGIDKNVESSFYYINTSARLEYPPAISKLGDFYYTGYGIKKDIDYAKMLYENAA
jgi:TPR repeat protein